MLAELTSNISPLRRTRAKRLIAKSCARAFCCSHPTGVTCRYCFQLVPERSISPQQALDAATAAQKAYWVAVAQLESVTGLEIDWCEVDLYEHTLASLAEEFPTH